MVEIRGQKRIVDLAGAGWLAAGVALWAGAWCRWVVAAVLLVAVGCCLWTLWRDGDSEHEAVSVSGRQIAGAAVLALVITAICGVGGFVVQSNDQWGRNAIFADLVNYPWPVHNEEKGLWLCYYHAFWLAPALIGKALGLGAGFAAQLLWSALGMVLLWLQVCHWMGKARVGYLLWIYLFSGLKIFEMLFAMPATGAGVMDFARGIMTDSTIVLGMPFHASSMAQSLYDPINQTVPVLLAMMLIFNNKRSLSILGIYALLPLYAPFPFIALFPIVAVLLWQNGRFKRLFNKQNIYTTLSALVLVLASGMYLLGNSSGGERSLRSFEINAFATAWCFLLYIVCNFGVYMWLARKQLHNKMLWIAAVGTVAAFAWIQIGHGNDFVFRSNLPLVFMVLLAVMREWYESRGRKRAIISAVVVLGAIPAQIHPGMRMLSSAMIAADIPQSRLNEMQHFVDVTQLYVFQQTKMRNDDLPTVLSPTPETAEHLRNFTSPQPSFLMTDDY